MLYFYSFSYDGSGSDVVSELGQKLLRMIVHDVIVRNGLLKIV